MRVTAEYCITALLFIHICPSYSLACCRYHTDPSGTLTPYAAHAIGNGSEGAVTILQEKYSRSMTLADAELLVLRILKETMEEKVSPSNVQIASVRVVRDTPVCNCVWLPLPDTFALLHCMGGHQDSMFRFVRLHGFTFIV